MHWRNFFSCSILCLQRTCIYYSSMPTKTQKPTRRPTPVSNTPAPTDVFTPFPTSTSDGTTFPTYFGDDAYAGYTDDINPDSSFNCPPASFVGCTAPNPSNPVDECPTIGQPCEGGNPGEYCCRDGCPRNYCTAKEFLGDDGFETPEPTIVDTPQPTPVSSSFVKLP